MGVATLISDRVDFTARKVMNNEEEHFIIMKDQLSYKDITVLNFMCLTTEHQNMLDKN